MNYGDETRFFARKKTAGAAQLRVRRPGVSAVLRCFFSSGA